MFRTRDEGCPLFSSKRQNDKRAVKVCLSQIGFIILLNNRDDPEPFSRNIAYSCS